MNPLKTQLDLLAHRLSRLTRAQKLSAGLIVSLVIAAALMWNRFDSAAQMQPLVTQALNENEIARITSRLQELGVRHQVTPDKKVLVAADRKVEVLSDLGYSDLLPGNAQGGFDDIVKQMTLWDSSSKTDKMYNRAKEMMLADVIGRFPGVKSAVVIIDPTSEDHIGDSVLPSASVSILTNGDGKNVRNLPAAVANVLSGAQANLQRERIRVTVDGVACSMTADDVAFNDDRFERKQQIGGALAAKVSEHLAIPNVLVSVSVDFGNPNWMLAFVRPVSKRAHSSPQIEAITAVSVNVPRSYFVNIFKASNPNAREPDDAVLQSIVSTGLDKIRHKVKACLGVRDESLITADCYADPAPALAAAQTLAASPVGWNARIKEIAIGALAMLTLLMLSMLVKRNHGAQLAPISVMALPFEQQRQLPIFRDVSDIDEDEDEIAMHVNALVDENPDRAATLVSRWLDLKR